MKRVMCLRFLNWPVQRRQRQLPAEQRSHLAVHTTSPDAATASKPKRTKSLGAKDVRFVRELFPAARGGPAIVSASEAAWKLGVRPGMPLAEARSMAIPLTVSNKSASKKSIQQTTKFYEWMPEKDRAELTELAELTRRFAPIVGLDESPVPDSLLLDLTGCGPLFGGESSLAEQLVQRLHKQSLRCQAAISDSVASAWAFAHAGGHALQQSTLNQRERTPSIAADWDLPVVVIPPGQSESWLNPLPVAAGRIPLADANLLAQLGILNLRQLFGLPLQDLPSRLSEEAITRIQQLRSIDEELITPIPEAHPVTATWVSEFAANNRSEIKQVVEYLTAEIADELQRRCLGAIRLTCTLKDEKREAQLLVAEVIKPLQSADDFGDVLALRLESMSFPQPIFSATMQACTAPLPVARQKDLFSTTEHVDPREELATVVNRLSNRLGKQAVLVVRPSSDPVPERAIEYRPLIEADEAEPHIEARLDELTTPTEVESTVVSPTNRPLTLLASPQRLDCSTPTGAKQSNPLQQPFVWQGVTYVPLSSSDRERIQTQWWHDVPVHRDYFRVTTDRSAEFWIFQNLPDGDWWLHGVFD